MTENQIKNKTCPKCGNSFECQGDDCWCHDLNILNKDMYFIRLNWDDCLCSTCLKQYSDNKN